MTDFRALCEKLLEALENEGHAHWPGGPDGDPLIEQARVALTEAEPEEPTDDPYLDNCSKAVLDRARQIDEMLAVNVYGPDYDPDTCASSWFTSKLIANLEARVSILESLP